MYCCLIYLSGVVMYASPSFEAPAPERGDAPSDEEETAARARVSTVATATASATVDLAMVDTPTGVRPPSQALFGEEDVNDEEDAEEEDEEEEEEDEEEEGEEDDLIDESEAVTAGSPTTEMTQTVGTAVGNTANHGNMNMASANLTIRAIPELKLGPEYREIGKEALCWQLSSAKPGNGVEQIRDASTDTYWQSDGVKQPHWIQVHFARRVALSHVCLYLDYSLDESYTPKRVSVHHGMTSQDLQSAVYPSNTEIEFVEPNGWCVIPLSSPPDPLDMYLEDEATDLNLHNQHNHCIRAHLLRISILSMHQNGRDTHVRQVQLYGPRLYDRHNVLLSVPYRSDLDFFDSDEEQDSNDDGDTLGGIFFPSIMGAIR